MGNPFPVGGGAAFGLEKLTHQKAVDLYELWIVGDFDGLGDYKVFADMYRKHNGFDSTVLIPQLIHDLRGHNLLCWCGLDQPCHADTLLRICNQ